ncbi:hypothetical protein CERZMDRAFT_87863 [Cercospora zeae-maydis SCOH1-5]|uniref:Uncharacterized protein n=1 Tax=Cercospora zeae-maydis SCOH1-5 TaxID=717836 RepID=A0A6A6F3C7_9PEZI|nr:hypothetical protein CERZMDRAFT_87863 [Cercospora zeae-maydis SCOH1-5]
MASSLGSFTPPNLDRVLRNAGYPSEAFSLTTTNPVSTLSNSTSSSAKLRESPTRTGKIKRLLRTATAAPPDLIRDGQNALKNIAFGNSLSAPATGVNSTTTGTCGTGFTMGRSEAGDDSDSVLAIDVFTPHGASDVETSQKGIQNVPFGNSNLFFFFFFG